MSSLRELLVVLVARLRPFLRPVVSELAQLGFSVVAAPVGCAVFSVTVLAGFALTVLLEALFGSPGVFGPLLPVAFVGGLVLAFVVLVRLYRAMPARVRRAIEIVDDEGPEPGGSPIVRPSTSLTRAELAQLDVKLAPPPDRPGQDA